MASRALVLHVVDDLVQLGDLRVGHVARLQQFATRFLQLRQPLHQLLQAKA